MVKYVDVGWWEKEKLLVGGGLGGEIKRLLGYFLGS